MKGHCHLGIAWSRGLRSHMSHKCVGRRIAAWNTCYLEKSNNSFLFCSSCRPWPASGWPGKSYCLVGADTMNFCGRPALVSQTSRRRRLVQSIGVAWLRSQYSGGNAMLRQQNLHEIVIIRTGHCVWVRVLVEVPSVFPVAD